MVLRNKQVFTQCAGCMYAESSLRRCRKHFRPTITQQIPPYSGTAIYRYIDKNFTIRRIPKTDELQSASARTVRHMKINRTRHGAAACQQPASRRSTLSLMRNDDRIIQHNPVRTLTLSIRSYFGREMSASSADLKCLHVGQHCSPTRWTGQHVGRHRPHRRRIDWHGDRDPSSTCRSANIVPICTLKYVLALVQYPNRCS